MAESEFLGAVVGMSGSKGRDQYVFMYSTLTSAGSDAHWRGTATHAVSPGCPRHRDTRKITWYFSRRSMAAMVEAPKVRPNFTCCPMPSMMPGSVTRTSGASGDDRRVCSAKTRWGGHVGGMRLSRQGCGATSSCTTSLVGWYVRIRDWMKRLILRSRFTSGRSSRVCGS